MHGKHLVIELTYAWQAFGAENCACVQLCLKLLSNVQQACSRMIW